MSAEPTRAPRRTGAARGAPRAQARRAEPEPGPTPAKRRSRATGARLDPQARRRQILDAAIAYFAEAGFSVQTRELTRRIGVSQPLLYRYFPSKQDLIAAVFEEVFLSRLRDEWVVWLRDRSVPLRARLLRFYLDYARVTYRPDWIRIYMYAGLAGERLNRDYLNVIRRRLLNTMCMEFREAFLSPAQRDAAGQVSSREIELVWNLHGNMFYWAVRRNIFGASGGPAFEARAADAIDLFIAGARAVYPVVVARSPSSTKPPR